MISTKINLIKHPLIEVIGFVIGKLTIIFLYILYVNPSKNKK